MIYKIYSCCDEPFIFVGTPNECLEKCRELEACGTVMVDTLIDGRWKTLPLIESPRD